MWLLKKTINPSKIYEFFVNTYLKDYTEIDDTQNVYYFLNC